MKIQQVLKWYLLVTSVYLIGDGLVHIFNFKLIDAAGWPQQSLVYAKFIGNLFGFFGILAASFGIEASRNLEKYRNFLYITAVWGLFYASYLIYNGLYIDFPGTFAQNPSIYFWLPFYNNYLIFEAILLLILSTLIFLFRKESRTKK